MIMVPGRIPDPHARDNMTWWEEILYIVGVSLYFIAWFVILIYVVFFL